MLVSCHENIKFSRTCPLKPLIRINAYWAMTGQDNKKEGRPLTL